MRSAISNAIVTARSSQSPDLKSKMAKLLAALGILLVVIVIASELTEARGRVRVRSSRTRTRSGSTSRTRRHFSPAGSSKVTKHTFIPVLTRSSPVIRRQAILSPRSHLYRNVFNGYMFSSYTLKKMPVYQGSFNMPNTVVQIPEERALRISFVSEILQDINGGNCLWYSSKNFTILPGVHVSSVQTKLTVNWSVRLTNNSNVANVTLDKDLLDKEIRVRTVVIYDGNMVANTTCRQVESEMGGTVVQMYATNPDAAGTIRCSLIAVALSSILYFFFLA